MGERITAHISDNHSPISHYVICPVCQGRITFNLNELEERRSKHQTTSIYCCGYIEDACTPDKAHYHPSFPGDAWNQYPAVSIRQFEWATYSEKETMSTIEEWMAKGKDEIEAEIKRLEDELAKVLALLEKAGIVKKLLETQKAHAAASAQAAAAVAEVKQLAGET